ncbi:MAG: YfhO family protein, partial [Prevotellaceae bacterium]|nr:YfhO family protein [Prevotellaceae bacterium]
RYQSLIDRYLSAEPARFDSAVGALAAQSDSLDMASLPLDSLTPCLNMLNAKYVIFRPDVYVENPRANGAGWFVDRLTFAPDADAEMKALGTLDTKREAVADERFRAALDGSALDSGSVRLTFYEPNEQVYSVTSRKGGVVVLSEIYYPGWTATIDGKPAETGRVNYVLRAVRVPAGHHTLRMTFRPASVARTEAAGYAALALILAGLLAALGLQWRTQCRKDDKQTQN